MFTIFAMSFSKVQTETDRLKKDRNQRLNSIRDHS